MAGGLFRTLFTRTGDGSPRRDASPKKTFDCGAFVDATTLCFWVDQRIMYIRSQRLRSMPAVTPQILRSLNGMA